MKKTILIIILLTGFASQGWATSITYYTYNSFESVDNALTIIELIFSDSGYEIILGGIALAYLVFSVGFAAAQNLFTGNGNIYVSLPAILGGIVIYFGTIVPVGTVVISDEVTNQTTVHSNVPELVVWVLGTTNMVEKAVVDMIDTTIILDEYRYTNGAGGIGFNLIYQVVSDNSPENKGQVASLEQYIDDCYIVEALRPGTGISYDSIKENSNFIDEFAKANSGSVYTVNYTTGDNAGQTMTCADSWNEISTYYSADANIDALQKSVCASAGLDPNNANQYAKCKDIIGEYSKISTGAQRTSVEYIRQAHLANTLQKMISKGADSSAMAMSNMNLMTSAMSTMLVANKYMPIIKGAITGISIVIIPILVLLIPSPKSKAALQTIFGFFIFLTAWGCIDAAIHAQTMAMAVDAFTKVVQNNMGLKAIMLTPDATMQALGMFGVMRMVGISLAAMMASVLGFNTGAVMAGAIGQMMAPVKQGATEAQKALQPGGAGREYSVLEKGLATMTQAELGIPISDLAISDAYGGQIGYYKSQESMEAGLTSDQAGHTGSYQDQLNASKVEKSEAAGLAPDRVAAAESFTKQTETETAERQQQSGLTPQDLASANTYGAHKSVAEEQRGQMDFYQQAGIDTDQERARFEAGGRVLSAEQAEQLRSKGVQAYPGMRMDQISESADGKTIAKGQVPVTEDNIKQLTEDLVKSDNFNAAVALRPGQMADFSMANGKFSTFNATGGASVMQKDTSTSTSAQTVDDSRNYRSGKHADKATILSDLQGEGKVAREMITTEDGKLDKVGDDRHSAALVEGIGEYFSKSADTSTGHAIKAGVGADTGKMLVGKMWEKFSGISGDARLEGWQNKSGKEQANLVRTMIDEKREAMMANEKYHRGGQFDDQRFTNDWIAEKRELYESFREEAMDSKGGVVNKYVEKAKGILEPSKTESNADSDSTSNRDMFESP